MSIRIGLFLLTFLMGLLGNYYLRFETDQIAFDRDEIEIVKPPVMFNPEGGTGFAACSAYSDRQSNCRPGAFYCPKNEEKRQIPAERKNVVPLKITSQPKPPYTALARENQIQGVVRLRVTFEANGKIGDISPVSGLPDGLLEQAISAAKNIKFEPLRLDGIPQRVTRVIEYRFNIY